MCQGQKMQPSKMKPGHDSTIPESGFNMVETFHSTKVTQKIQPAIPSFLRCEIIMYTKVCLRCRSPCFFSDICCLDTSMLHHLYYTLH